MRIALVALALALLATFGCRGEAQPDRGRPMGAALTPSTSPQDSLNVVLTNQVSHVDASTLGWDVPLNVAIASGPGAEGGIQSVDTTPGDNLSTKIFFSSPGTAGVISDGGAGSCGEFVGAIVTSSSVGYWSLVQSTAGVIDAGGMASASVVPLYQMYVAGPQTLSTGLVAAGILDAGAIWQASSSLGVIQVDAGVPNMTGVVLCR